MIVSSDPNIRTFLASRSRVQTSVFECSDCLGSDCWGRKRANASSKLGPPIPTAREAGSLGRMEDDRKDFEPGQQRRNLPLAERTAAAELSPFPVRVGGELGDELGGRNLLACSENWLQGGEQSDALGWLVALVRQVHRRGARRLGPKAPGDVSDRQQQTPVRRHPVAEARRHNRICILKQQSIIGGPAHELRRSVVKSSSSTWRKSAT